MNTVNTSNKIDDSFYFNSDIESIDIPNNITHIGKRAFASNHNLKRVIIPNSITSIDDEAFADCTSLEEIILPDSITFLGEKVFSNCKNLKRIKLPKNIKKLPKGFFKNCKDLDLILDSTIEEIDDEVFMGCSSLSNFPKYVKKFGKNGFKYCHKLTKANLCDDVEYLSDGLFDDCINLNKVTYNGQKNIRCGKRCFRNCKSLDNIPYFIREYSEGMFEGCDGLTEITINCFYVPQNCFRNCINLKIVNNANIVSELGSNAFANCISLEEIDISKLSIIRPGTFKNCHSLKGVKLCNYLRNIGEEAFMNCYKLVDFRLPDMVEIIAKRALKHCDSIKEITIPGALKRVHDESFSYMASLERINVSPYNKKFKTPDHKILICEGTQKLILYASGLKDKSYSLVDYCLDTYEGTDLIRPLTYIGPYAFAGANNLEELTLCTCVSDIECNAFDGCHNLTKLVLQELPIFSCQGFHLRENGRYYFKDYSKYKVNMPFKIIEYRGEVVAILNEAIPFCDNVESIILSKEGSYPIYNQAFNNCVKVKEIIIPKNVTSIGKDAFGKDVTLTFMNGLVLKGLVELINNSDYKKTYKLYRLSDDTYYIEEKDTILKLTKKEIDDAVSHSDSIRENPLLFLDFFNDLKNHEFNNIIFYNGILMSNMSMENRAIMFEKLDPNDLDTLNILESSTLLDFNDATTQYLLSNTYFDNIIKYIDILKKHNVKDKELFHKYFMRYMNVKDFERLLDLDRELLLSIIRHANLNDINDTSLLSDIYSNNRLERYIILLKKYNLKDKFLYNRVFISLADETLIEKLLSRYNANIKRLIIESGILENISSAKENMMDLLVLMNITGSLEDDDIISQKATTFITEKMFMKKLPNGNMNGYRVHGDDIHRVFNFRLIRDDFDLEFANFFLENYQELIDNERSKAGFIERCYLNFKEISRTSTSDKGSQRKLKVTIDKCISYLSNVKFDGVNKYNKELADLISAWYDSNDIWIRAQIVYKEAKKAPRNIFTKIEVDDEGKLTYDYNPKHDLKEKISEDFSYEWLPKQDMQNLVLGKYCNCCAHIAGAGQGIMRASMILDNVQNLVIRNSFGEIIAKSTLYVNRKLGYAVFNNVESSINFRDTDSLKKIYMAFMRGAKAFLLEYNKNNNVPITEMTIGASRNTILSYLNNENHPTTSIHQSLEYGNYSIEDYHYAGDWKSSQRLVLKY